MKLTPDQVKKVAKLANLEIDDNQVQIYSKQLSKILDYIDQLENVDTQKTEPTFNVSGLQNIMDQDEVKESLTGKEALSNACESKDGFFVTKGVFNEE